MAQDLFVYGTLMFDPVLQALLGRVPESLPARLRDCRRTCFVGEVFPVIRHAPGESVDGLLLRAVSSAEFAILDRYEGDVYLRENISVECSGLGECAASTYILAPGCEHYASDCGWNPNDFVQHHLQHYLEKLRPGLAARNL